ncbi:pilus assembly protein N-terminal domain-containing protein [Oceaniradius stylonematis]|uniref:pilus assembly protein N-terminal domain-containing protein n=1 Tax=Oceaniradius stylonematis TaxID=2184161 RepID=UPI00273F5491|nr:pilus assembly protein N-terminal domain-containing protein [Oceaniradius stylonematis]
MALRVAGVVALSLMFAVPLAGPANAEPVTDAGVEVVLNQAKVLKLSRAASTVIIGNPGVADATVHDANTIVLTGQGFGRTNIVVLDGAGTPILDEQVAVVRDDSSTLRIYRRSIVETLSCEPFCEWAYQTPAEIESTRERARVNAMFEAGAGGDADLFGN